MMEISEGLFGIILVGFGVSLIIHFIVLWQHRKEKKLAEGREFVDRMREYARNAVEWHVINLHKGKGIFPENKNQEEETNANTHT